LKKYKNSRISFNLKKDSLIDECIEKPLKVRLRGEEGEGQNELTWESLRTYSVVL